MKKNRSTLKDYFKKGAIPTEANFADLIDSMLNQEEDSIAKLPNDPLKITAIGVDEALVNFYRIDKNAEQLSWQVKQKLGGVAGLSISDAVGSRLFIENGTGNIGIGTTTPGAKLEVSGSAKITGDLQAKTLTVDGEISVGSKSTAAVTDATAGYGAKLSFNGASLNTDPIWMARYNEASNTTKLRINLSDDNVRDQLQIGYTYSVDGKWYTSFSVDTNGDTVIAGNLAVSGAQISTDGVLTVKGTGASSIAGSLTVGSNTPGTYKLNVTGNALFTGDYFYVSAETAGRLRVGAAWNIPGLYSGDDGAKDLILGVPANRKVYLGNGTGDAYIEGTTGNAYFKGYMAAKPVYFSAYVESNSRTGAIDKLPMQVASQNVGDGYNTSTSTFTAPVKGVYLFTMTAYKAEESGALHWYFLVNGASANAGGTNTSESDERTVMTMNATGTTTSRTMIIVLNAGDKVTIKQAGSGRVDNFRSGLEGVLLYAIF